jgi:uncharacterized protein YdeI (YjbR/CyaY-like superfamily)
VQPETLAQWRAWLQQHHARAQGVWLVSFKKASGKATFGYDEAVEEALCFGWIDSKPRKLDAQRSMLWFAPRKAGSGWSAPNKARIERILAQGRMHPSGQARLDAAKADGSWSALDAVERLELPPDLLHALAALDGAAAHFEAFPRSAKRGILEWIVQAKRPQTRAARVAETARLAAINQRANQWRGKGERDGS